MVNSEADGLTVPSALERVLPVMVTKIEQYFGSFVRLTCAAPSGEELELRVYLADWVFSAKGIVLADSAGGASGNNERLSALVGEKLLEFVINGGDKLSLMFTGEMALQVIADLDEYEPDDELLIAYLDVALLKFVPNKGFLMAPPVRIEH